MAVLKLIRHITRDNGTSNSIDQIVDSAKKKVLTNWSSVENE